MQLEDISIPVEVEPIFRRLSARYTLEFEPLVVSGRKFNILHLKDLEPLLAGRDIFAESAEFPFWVKIWEASVVLADFLAGLPPKQDQSLLEVGAGLGVTGLVGAAFGHRVTITDYQNEILDFSRVSAAVNGCEGVLFSILDWTALRNDRKYDVILGSEVLFHEQFFQPLLDVFKHCLAPDGAIYLAHDLRRESLARFLPMCEADYDIAVKKRTLRAEDESFDILLTRLTPK